ncbi:MAG: hypothetical protein GY913_24125 [Proteobacteria bacterium]|nr:hypothetical protein [Pseudomonadota bacterium]MCP4920002.1 hypothetical protein [Pseudomonadota bacterium]
MSDFPDVMAHGELTEEFPDIFWVQGTVRMAPGMLTPRNMVVLRHEGDLTLLNTVRLDEDGLAALDALGQVKHLVKLGSHGMDDPFYLDRYGASRWGCPGVTSSSITHRLGEDVFPVRWAEVFLFEQTLGGEGALLADRDGGVLLTCDAVQNWPDTEGCSLLAKPITLAAGFTARSPVIGPPWRRAMTPKGGSLRGDFDRLAALSFEHVIGAHGKPLRGGAQAALVATVQATF